VQVPQQLVGALLARFRVLEGRPCGHHVEPLMDHLASPASAGGDDPCAAAGAGLSGHDGAPRSRRVLQLTALEQGQVVACIYDRGDPMCARAPAANAGLAADPVPVGAELEQLACAHRQSLGLPLGQYRQGQGPRPQRLELPAQLVLRSTDPPRDPFVALRSTQLR